MNHLVLLAIVRNERPEYLIEWREHHERLGVEWTYLIEHSPNQCPIPDMSRTTVCPVGTARAQMAYYAQALPQIAAEWCVVIDADEFIVCDDLLGMLAQTKADALAMNWMVFGSSGHEHPVYPVHGSYHWRTETGNPINRHIKSIVRPRAVRDVSTDPHHFHVKTVNERGEEFSGPFNDYCGTKIRLNHYFTRSKEDWDLKMARGRVDCCGVHQPSMFDQVNTDCTVNDPVPTRL
jgi:hypothetical protein